MKLGNIELNAETYTPAEVEDLAKRYADDRVRVVSEERNTVKGEVEKLREELTTVKAERDKAATDFETKLANSVKETEDKVRGELAPELDKVRAELEEVRGGVAGTFDEQLAAFKAKVGENFTDVIDSLPGSSAEKVSYLIKHGDLLFNKNTGFGNEAGSGGSSMSFADKARSMPGSERSKWLANSENMKALRDELHGNGDLFAEIINLP